MVIRAWTHWDLDGTKPSAFDFGYIAATHAVGTQFVGGEVATVVFGDEIGERATTRCARS